MSSVETTKEQGLLRDRLYGESDREYTDRYSRTGSDDDNKYYEEIPQNERNEDILRYGQMTETASRIRIDDDVNVPKDVLTSNSTFSEGTRSKQPSLKRILCWTVATSALVAVVIVVGTLAVTGYLKPYTYGGHMSPPETHSSRVTPVLPWGRFHLDHEQFRPGDKYLPWKLGEGNGGFTTTGNSCFIIPITGLLDIRSKVTFVINGNTGTTSGLYHNMFWQNATHTSMLEQNRISLPRDLPPTFYVKSELTNIGSYQAGSRICVMVSDTRFVYQSMVENKNTFLYRR